MTIVSVIFLLTGLSSAFAVTLESLDAPLREAGSLEELLKSPQLLGRYRKRVTKYFSIQPSQFDAIMSQVAALTYSLPELSKRLWENENLAPTFSIDVLAGDKRMLYREFNVAEWNANLKEWVEKNRSLASPLLREVNEPNPQEGEKRYFIADFNAIQSRVLQLEEDIQKFETENSLQQKKAISLTEKKSASRQRSIFYYQLRQSDAVKELTAVILWSKWNHLGETRLKLESNEASAVLNALDELKQKAFGAKNWSSELRHILGNHFKISDLVLSRLSEFVADRIPSSSKVLANQKIFHPTKNEHRLLRYDFKPFPRRLHALWVHPWSKECISGHLDYLEWATPRRWLVNAIKGSQLQVMEQDGQFLGASRVIPISKDKATLYGSLEIAIPTMRQRMRTEEKGRLIPLFELWLKKAYVYKPNDIQGFVLSESRSVDNAKVFEGIRLAPQYVLGKEIGSAAFFRVPPDAIPAEATIFKKIESLELSSSASYIRDRHNLWSTYYQQLIFDATLAPKIGNSVGALTLLLPIETDVFRDEEAIADVLDRAHSTDLKIRMVEYLHQQKIYSPRIVEHLLKLIGFESKDELVAEERTARSIRQKAAETLFYLSEKYMGAMVLIVDSAREGNPWLIYHLEKNLATTENLENEQMQQQALKIVRALTSDDIVRNSACIRKLTTNTRVD